MASIIGYSEVQKVYLDFKNNNITTVLMGIGITIGLLYTIYKIIDIYLKDMTDNETVDVKKLLLSFKPHIKFILLIPLIPFTVTYIELFLGEIERLILSKTGNEPLDIIQHAKDELDNYNMGVTNLLTGDLRGLISYFVIMVIKPIMVFIDSYLFTFVIAARFLKLLFLEIISPLAVISLAFSDQRFFKSWLNDMFICYLYVPGFMLANSFAEAIYKYMIHHFYESTLSLLFLIALKIYLYTQVKTFINKVVIT